MDARRFPLRSDSAPEEARGEDTPSVSSRELHFAGVEGIEPPLAVLETAVLPLNDTPKSS